MTTPIDLGIVQFISKKDAIKFFSNMLNKYERQDKVSQSDDFILRELIKHHPFASFKIGRGVDHFYVDLEKGGTRCFYIKRTDGTHIDFSFPKCVRNYRPQPVEA